MEVQNRGRFRPVIYSREWDVWQENRRWLIQEFGISNVVMCEEITHPKEEEIVDIPDDRATSDNDPYLHIIPAGRYRVTRKMSGPSSHRLVFENLSDGTEFNCAVAYHDDVQVDWRGCRRISSKPARDA